VRRAASSAGSRTEEPTIGESLPFLFVGVVLFVLAGLAERRRRTLGPAGSAALARAPLVIAACGLVDILLAFVVRSG
jgi:hypothetical protein